MPSFLVTLVPVPSLVTVLLTAQHHMAAHCLSPSAHSCTPHCGSALASRFPYISNPTFPSASSGNDSPGEREDIQGESPSLAAARRRCFRPHLSSAPPPAAPDSVSCQTNRPGFSRSVCWAPFGNLTQWLFLLFS